MEDLLSAACNEIIRRSTILVAEDDEMDAFMIETAFCGANLRHLLKFVRDGQEAIHYLQGNAPYSDRRQFPVPDLLLLDLKMPRVDGFEVLRWLQLSGLSGPPVLVLSGSDLEPDKERALKLGAREYHVKSGELAKMRDFLKEVCERWLAQVG